MSAQKIVVDFRQGLKDLPFMGHFKLNLLLEGLVVFSPIGPQVHRIGLFMILGS